MSKTITTPTTKQKKNQRPLITPELLVQLGGVREEEDVYNFYSRRGVPICAVMRIDRRSDRWLICLDDGTPDLVVLNGPELLRGFMELAARERSKEVIETLEKRFFKQ